MRLARSAVGSRLPLTARLGAWRISPIPMRSSGQVDVAIGAARKNGFVTVLIVRRERP